jgi:phosphate transport system substrate-binding protein
VRWPRGIRGRGNEGVATFVQHLPGAIGYVAWDFTKQNHMAYTAMKNASGAVVEPGAATFKAAAAGADWSKTFYQILTNEPGKDAWPVVGATFVLLHVTQDKADRGEETLKFFDWAFTNGNRAAEDLDYIPLPESAVTEIRSEWRAKVKDALGRPVTVP